MKRIICYGDSNTYGYSAELNAQPNCKTNRFDESIRYPKVLQALLGNEHEVIEEGCGGRTTDCDDGIQKHVNGLTYLYPCLCSHCPAEALIIMLGTNDFGFRQEKTAESTTMGLRNLLEEVCRWSKDRNCAVPRILIMSPVPFGKINGNVIDEGHQKIMDESGKLRIYYRKLADEYGCDFLAAEDYAEVSSLDGIHLTATGHRALGKAVYEKLREMDI